MLLLQYAPGVDVRVLGDKLPQVGRARLDVANHVKSGQAQQGLVGFDARAFAVLLPVPVQWLRVNAVAQLTLLYPRWVCTY